MMIDEHSSMRDSSSITCMMCGDVFSLREGEQDFFAQRGLDLPKRCPPCRAERKAQSTQEGSRQSHSSPSPTSQVECHHCYRATVVPFTPREGSDVYCRVCWEGIKNVGTSGAVYV